MSCNSNSVPSVNSIILNVIVLYSNNGTFYINLVFELFLLQMLTLSGFVNELCEFTNSGEVIIFYKISSNKFDI